MKVRTVMCIIMVAIMMGFIVLKKLGKLGKNGILGLVLESFETS